MIEFPKNFFWGSAISAHQVEGGNVNNDWWQDEAKGVFKVPSGDACRHYQLYKQDFDLARQLNQNCLRISIEWSRVEPREGEFDESAISHYVDVVRELRRRNIEPVITLHHFTNPVWFNKKGAWLNRNAAHYFSRFTDRIAQAVCRDVKYWATINEPMIYLYFGYLLGCWPPHKKGVLNLDYASWSLAASHISAYKTIHSIYQKNNLNPPFVSIAQNMRYFSGCKNNFLTRLAVAVRNQTYNLSFLNTLYRHKALDFIGVNYYTRENVLVTNPWIGNIIFQVCNADHDGIKRNSLGWEVYPQGLRNVLLELKRFQLPVFILENGICTQDDSQRWDYIREHLICLHQAMQEGVDVIGYLYWSLIDNFEWDKGFTPRFGLIEIDYNNYARRIRESALKFSEVCKDGRI